MHMLQSTLHEVNLLYGVMSLQVSLISLHVHMCSSAGTQAHGRPGVTLPH